ncbi:MULTISPECIES: protein kinase domain-containing protein [Streptacidiphilus]|uniref:Protein kinase n=1 Tax=Streptacidiphilus cavernicola TaxID=3342716 RepID=A0ABV6UMJ8_9ACTN|nr:protein kinase [Streptacidiphilus jeojiense]
MQPLGSTDPQQVGPYRLLGRLGDGGMGSVYLGRSAGGRTVAVKVVRREFTADEEFRARFRREVQAARAVSGPFTAQLVDADPDAELPWLATAFVAGVALSAAVRRHGPLPEQVLRVLGTGLAEALQDIHRAGVIHRDLKPSNVMLAADGPHVIDFGISRSTETSALTSAGLVVGSPGFLSPEQATGATVVPATDVFALGATLAFAGLGTGPFGAGPTPALLYRVVSQEPELAGLPDALREIVHACLAKEPSGRPSPDQLVSLLAADPADVAGAWLPAEVMADIVAESGVLTGSRQFEAPATAVTVPAASVPAASGVDPRLGFGSAGAPATPAGQTSTQQSATLPTAPSPAPAAILAPQPRGLPRRAVLGLLGGAVVAGGGAVAYALSSDGKQSGSSDSAKGSGTPSASRSRSAVVALADAPQRKPLWHTTFAGLTGSVAAGSGTVVVGLSGNGYRALAPADSTRLWAHDVALSADGGSGVPYFDGRTVYLTGSTGSGSPELQAIDTDNGSLRWKVAASDSDQALAGVQGKQAGVLYVSGFDSRGQRGSLIWAVDAGTHSTSSVRWSPDYGAILPGDSDSVVIAVGGRDALRIGAYAAGAKKWQRTLAGLAPMGERTTMYAAAGSKLYVVANGLHVLDRATGKDLVATVPLGQSGPGRVLASGTGRLFAAAGNALYGIRPSDGGVQWTVKGEQPFVQIDGGDTGTASVTMAASANTLYALDARNTLYALDAATGSCTWRFAAPQSATCYLAAYGEYAFLTADSTLYTLT